METPVLPSVRRGTCANSVDFSVSFASVEFGSAFAAAEAYTDANPTAPIVFKKCLLLTLSGVLSILVLFIADVPRMLTFAGGKRQDFFVGKVFKCGSKAL